MDSATLPGNPAPRYWPGQDYPDREQWLAKRYTPPRNRRAALYFDSTRWGTLNMGVNEAKRKARAEQAEWGKRSVRGLLWPANSPLRRQLLTIRHKAQTQGFVTIEPNEAGKRQTQTKRYLGG